MESHSLQMIYINVVTDFSKTIWDIINYKKNKDYIKSKAGVCEC